MGAGSKILDFFTGGLGGKLVEGTMEIIKGRFPEKLSERDRLEIEMIMTQQVREYEIQGERLAQQETVEFNQRIKDMEGTTADLKTVPYFGPFVIFLRGVQRPFWGFGVFVLDWIWLVKDTTQWSDKQEVALLIINILVLGFLFGERALKNVMPLITEYVSAKK